MLGSVNRYGAFRHRIEKSVDWDDSGGKPAVTTGYALDGWNPAKPTPTGNENFDVFADLNGNSSLTTRYFRGDVVDQLFARIDGTDPFWYLTDHLGSVRDILDDVGDLATSVVYDAWGNILTETDADHRGRYAWTGREYDVETELQYNRARYYDATTGRWITQDPLGFDAGDSNLYRYVKNRPIIMRDPSGLWEDDLHFYMTYYIGRRIGLDAFPLKIGTVRTNEAYVIAWAALYTDYASQTDPLTFKEDTRRKFHFYASIGRKVQAGSQIAHAPIRIGIYKGNLMAIGIGMHILQDSFSHHGFETSHWRMGVPFSGRGPDLPWNNQDKAKETAKATFDILIEHLEINHPNDFKKRLGEGRAAQVALERLWNAISDEIVGTFANTRFAKHVWEALSNESILDYKNILYRHDLDWRVDLWRDTIKEKFGEKSWMRRPIMKRAADDAWHKEFLKGVDLIPHPIDAMAELTNARNARKQ